MRVALVVERFAPRGGGVEGVTWSIAHHLAARGDDVSIYCRVADGAPQGARVHALPVSDIWQPWRTTAFARRVERAVAAASPRPTVVHAFTRTRHQDVYRAGAGRHAEFLRSTHGAVGAAMRRLSPRHRIALNADARILADRAQWIVCPSRLVADALVRDAGIGAERVEVIPNGVDPSRFRPGSSDAVRALRERHARPDETVWLFAGSGARRKGLDVAIAALARARSDGATLWVVGRDDPAPWRRRARRAGVADRVRFLGSSDEMPDVYRAADALVLPTRYDPFANVCLEAAATGLPVVSTSRNGAMEVIGDAGVVCAPDDVAAVATAMDRLHDPALRRALGVEARKRAEGCEWAGHVDRLRDLYARVVERRRRETARP